LGSGIDRDDAVESWIQVFEIHGYKRCKSRALEKGFEKVAIFLGVDGEPSHVARQMESGLWTSKLGYRGKDIIHRRLESLEGDSYGSVAQVMKRRGKGQATEEIEYS
jgi:hypothetical protein